MATRQMPSLANALRNQNSGIERLNSPHGGVLVSLMATPERREQLQMEARDWRSCDLTPRQLCDLELLLSGAFSPLRGFMGSADYNSVCSRMRLSDNTLWPMPIVLDVTSQFASTLAPGQSIALRDAEGLMIAALRVEEVWEADRVAEAEMVFGTSNRDHPGVAHLLNKTNSCYVSGRLEGIQPPPHYDFQGLRFTPAEVRSQFASLGWKRIVAFQTRNPMHRAHWELTYRAARAVNAKLLIQPVVGLTKPGDVDYFTRVRCYQAMMQRYPKDMARLALLPLAMRMGGPREAVWHAAIRKNFGCTHLIVGRDHAGPGSDSSGKPFYGPYAAQELLRTYEQELGIKMVPFNMMQYVEELRTYVPDDEIAEGNKCLSISGTELRQRLAQGAEIPEWFTFPEVARELRRSYPPRQQQGFTIFFTGLSGAGKSTIANVLLTKLLELGGRRVTLLDGDLVRKHLSSELGFSREHRDLNIRRIGYVSSEITNNGGIAICAPIAPYDAVRKEVRKMVEPCGGFVLVHLSTPLAICEQRDRKGLYAKARAGLVQQFTGISDPYELPEDAEITINTSEMSADGAAQQILYYLERNGFLILERTEQLASAA